MYKAFEFFRPPGDESTTIWRYMDFTKFVAMLESSTLFFAPIAALEDRFEGTIPNELFRGHMEALTQRYPGTPEAELLELAEAQVLRPIRLARLATNVNCWHASPHESVAMWNLYVKSGEGIAVQSTYERLIRSITDEREVGLGEVSYVDFKPGEVGPIDMGLFLKKRKSFEHEREIRAMVLDQNAPDRGTSDGSRVRVDLTTLVEVVYVAPGSPAWMLHLVESVRTKYGFAFPVRQSRLDEDPLI